ncbi:actin-histidine N-methyltransferase [Strongylocentrotus purpuratus]|uniref:protein-histidine N-methyltransferase n=1 Tax=Strongylocentrotus purpuratus TaxID=7668 RepID=A0A7M7RFI3_STRPU|nr:actin-histidine N-methyltransferase [Strongylocentrotus purpuratus]XP_798530.3 actin-histidine N-methyltransferase [Strongylocentrotus purpuratus]
MGRKSKRKANPGPDEVSKADRKELIKLCGQVIDFAATPSPPTPGEQWEEFLQIHNLIEKIRKRQNVAGEPMQQSDREVHFETFFKWLNTNGVTTDAVKMAKFDEGYGLQATQDIKMDQELMNIPRKVMMTDQNAVDSPTIGDLVRGDRLLKGMPNVSLAIFILSEKLKSDSFWKPYLDVLPSSYSLPLYFTPDEIQLFQGSTMYGECLKQHKNIARQYAYLFKLLNLPENSKLHIREYFTYDFYRWAVSTVMTRQNQIPAKDGKGMSLSLIPLWDMCNHANGEMKTDFIEERDSCVNMALRDFSVGEQIFICYGRRSSADLLLYSGFVYPGNVYDGMAIQLGLSSSDRLYAMKAQLCSVMKLGVPSQNYHISAGKEPVTLELLTFLRIFCMQDLELRDRLLGDNRAQALFSLVDRSQIISKLNELRTCVYLATRVTLLQRQYKTSIQEDEEKLKDGNLSAQERSALQLLLIEKCTLENVLKYCAFWRERIEALPEDATAFELKREEDEGVVVEKWEDREEVGSSKRTDGEDGDGETGIQGGVVEGLNGVQGEKEDGVVGDTKEVENGENKEKTSVKANGENTKVNGDGVLENGINGHDETGINGQDASSTGTKINGGTPSPAKGLVPDLDTTMKTTPNKNANMSDGVVSNGNGHAHDESEILPVNSGLKKVNGAINGHSAIAPASGSIEE